MKEQNKLCARNERYGTLDLWINDEKHWEFGNSKNKFQIIATLNGQNPDSGYAYMITLDEEPTKALDDFMGYISRDTQNWGYRDIVIHWGVHTWKFYNKHNITDIENDEYAKNLDDIKYFYDIEM